MRTSPNLKIVANFAETPTPRLYLRHLALATTRLRWMYSVQRSTIYTVEISCNSVQ